MDCGCITSCVSISGSYVVLENCDHITVVDRDVLTSQKLYVKIQNCPNLESVDIPFSCQAVCIKNCENLKSIYFEGSALNILLVNLPALLEVDGDFSQTGDFKVEMCSSLQAIPKLKYIDNILVNECHSIQSVNLSSYNLSGVNFSQCDNLSTVTFKDSPNINILRFWMCRKLLAINGNYNVRTILEIDRCPNVASFSSLKTKPRHVVISSGRFSSYNWDTHENRFLWKRCARIMKNAIVKNYHTKQKERVLALQLNRYGLVDVSDHIYKFLLPSQK
jgi:hypothetical protein